jgi:transcriptional regulator with AAA-type ATPase domain
METLFAYGAEDPLRMMIDTIPRLNGFPIQIPSLHERVDDIPLLVEYLIERYAKKAGKKIRNIRR